MSGWCYRILTINYVESGETGNIKKWLHLHPVDMTWLAQQCFQQHGLIAEDFHLLVDIKKLSKKTKKNINLEPVNVKDDSETPLVKTFKESQVVSVSDPRLYTIWELSLQWFCIH